MVEAVISRSGKNKSPISNEVFGMSVFIFTEIMFFMALISAFLVIQKDRGATWDLPESIVLPYLVTGLNTVVLLASGVSLWWAGRVWKDAEKSSSQKWLLRSALLAGSFVFIQGGEWLQLLEHGMNAQASIYGACFFLLVGSHAVHALAGAVLLFYSWWLVRKNNFSIEKIKALQVFWFLVVGIWPIIYAVVYF